MSSVGQCSLFPSYVYEQWIRPPYEEGRLQFAYAIFQNKAATGEAPSLAERTVHIITAALLFVPIVNWVVYLAMQYFQWTISEGFQAAVASGDGRLVAFYLSLGVDPKQYGDALLYQTDNHDVIRALLSHGVSPHALSTDNETFPEYLINKGDEAFLRELIQEKHIDFDAFLNPEMFLKARGAGNNAFLKFMIEMGYEGKEEHFLGLNFQVGPDNSLARAAFNHDAQIIDRLAKSQSFQEFCADYVTLKTEYPHVQTEWIWNALFKIPSNHFRDFKDVGGADEVVGPPPSQVSLTTMIDLFNRINFSNPQGTHYITEDQRKETLDKVVNIRSVAYLREGLVNIREKMTGSRQDETGADAEELRNHKLYLEWVIYYLGLDEPAHSVEPLDRVKAQVLIDMGKAGKVCSGRWKELFYECRCRLSKEEIKELSFEEQVMVHLGALRSMIIYRIVHGHAHGCTHARDNLVFHLKDVRGLPGDKPAAVFDHEGIAFRTPQSAREAFDAHYTPSSEIAHISEQVKAKGQKASDFNNLVLDYMNVQFAEQLQMDPLTRMRDALGAQRMRMTYDAVEAFFRGYDANYVVNREQMNLAEFFNRLTTDPLFAPFGEIFEWPGVEAVSFACSEGISDKRRQLDDLIKLFVDPGEYDRLKQDKEVAAGAFNEAQKQFEAQLKQQERFSRYEALRPSIERGSASTEEQREFAALITQYAPWNYVQLRTQADQTLIAFGDLCRQIRTNMQKASPVQLQQAKALLSISEATSLTGPQLMMLHYLRLDRKLSALESGNVGTEAIKRAFQDQAGNLVVKQDQTLRNFMASPAFQALRGQLGELPNIDALLLDQPLSNPAVKKVIAGFFAEIALTIAPKLLSEYFNTYQNEIFMHLVRPLDEMTGASAIPEEGIQPLAVGMLLRQLGHLAWQNEEYFPLVL